MSSFIWVSNWSSNQVCCKCTKECCSLKSSWFKTFFKELLLKAFTLCRMLMLGSKRCSASPAAFHPAKLIRLRRNSHLSVRFCLPSPPCNPAEYGGDPETRVKVLTWKNSYRWDDAPMRDRRKTAEPDLKTTTNLVWWENGCESHPSHWAQSPQSNLVQHNRESPFY